MVRNRVWLVLGLGVALALTTLPLVTHAPNRLVSGRGLPLWEAAPAALACLVAGIATTILIAAFVKPSRLLQLAIAGLGLCGAAAILLAAALAARTLAEGSSPAARTALASASFIAAAGFLLTTRDALHRACAGAALQTTLFLCWALLILTMIFAGWFDEISLMKEFQPRRDVFGAEALRHITISLGALVMALIFGLGLGLAAHARQGAGSAVLSLLNVVQVIPAIALFALLMAPLGWLANAVPALRAAGLAGIGPAPAMIALVLYLLLPIVSAVVAGLGQVNPAIREAACGMGFSARQRLAQVDIPLAAPVILAGIRVAAVQAIGLATLAALVGGGGLGTFVFQGMGQFALDLVLLGVLPIAVLAVLADAGLRMAELALQPEGTG